MTWSARRCGAVGGYLVDFIKTFRKLHTLVLVVDFNKLRVESINDRGMESTLEFLVSSHIVDALWVLLKWKGIPGYFMGRPNRFTRSGGVNHSGM